MIESIDEVKAVVSNMIILINFILLYASQSAVARAQGVEGSQSTQGVIELNRLTASSESKSARPAKKKSKGRKPREKEAEGTQAPNRFDADTFIKSRYEVNGQSLEVDTE